MYLRNWTYALVQEKYFVDAIHNIRKSIELDPVDPENWYLWGHILFATGDYISAKHKYEMCGKADPEFRLGEKELTKIANVIECDKAFSGTYPISGKLTPSDF